MKYKMSPPAILGAHDLREGHVVYWTGNLWSRDINQAKIAHSDEEIFELDNAANTHLKQNDIVDALIFPISQIAYKISSKTLRESFLISGPTIAYVEPTVESAINVSL